MPHFEFINESQSKPQLYMSRREGRALLEGILNDVTRGEFKIIELIRPVKFFSPGFIFNVGSDKIKKVYVTNWFIFLIENEHGFRWQSDAPTFLSPKKRLLSKIMVEIERVGKVPPEPMYLPYKHEPLPCEHPE